MFESDIWTGVGIDRYGDYYRIFRDADATFRLGPSSVANYAHNVFLQLLATGGLFLVIAYLSTLALVVFASVKGFRKFQGQDNVYDHKEVKHIHFKDVRELREEKLNQLGIK
jgi:hypothetical protein